MASQTTVNPATPEGASVFIEAVLAQSFSFAAWQNSVPLIKHLRVVNHSAEPLVNLELKLTASPALVRPRGWHISRLDAGAELVIQDRDVELDADYLRGLNESERGYFFLSLLQGEDPVAVYSQELRILARDEWGGVSDMAELLAAFVVPNAPTVAEILKSASDLLQAQGHPSSLEGYQRQDPQRVYLIASAIWNAIAARKLTYAMPPASFESVGQKVRLPDAVLATGLATCLDTTLLFAAALEAAGLHAVIVLQQGHCFAGVWLVEHSFHRLVETNCSEVRKALASQELITFETTLAAQTPPAAFATAISTAKQGTREAEEAKFVAVIDIARARMAQIRPLASHVATKLGTNQLTEAVSDMALTLEDAPEFERLVPEPAPEEKPSTPAGRIDRWQRKLLDLTLRNRLLNFRDSKQTIPFICPDVPLLEDKLAAGKQLRVISAPDEVAVKDRDAELHYQRTKQDLAQEFARLALDRDEMASSLSGNELNLRLTEIHRKVKNDLAEGGTNTLFLAIGFLRWKRQPEDERAYRAPLLLVPVSLVRSSAKSPYRIKLHEDEVRFNSTLTQMLKRDFERDLTRLESELPTDEHGIDVPRLLKQLRQEVRDMPSFEILDETALSTFSFSKYLMWKDLVDRIGQLEDNRVVRHLIRDPEKPFQSESARPMPHSDEMDHRYTPEELVHPLSADSSQLAAVMAAAEGGDFVLIGPPGTGKSQTIANMIAQCLQRNKTVLFVAEKTAALDVVYRRLRENGLGDVCLELHSNKAERRGVLSQLQAAWENGLEPVKSDWIRVSSHLQIRRDELNRYVEALHAPDESGWTVYRAMGIAVRDQQREVPALDWPQGTRINREKYRQQLDSVTELTRAHGAVDPAMRLNAVNATQWSAAWEAELLEAAKDVESVAVGVAEALAGFLTPLGVHCADCSFEELQHFRQLCKALVETANDDYRIIFHKQLAEFPAAVAELQQAILALKAAQEGTAGHYSLASVQEMPVDDLLTQWRTACAKIWPLSFFAKRSVTRLLQTYAEQGTADPQQDLPQLRSAQQQLQVIDASKLAVISQFWKRHETDTAALLQHIQQAEATRDAILSVGRITGSVKSFATAIFPALPKSAESIATAQRAQRLHKAIGEFRTSIEGFRRLAMRYPFERESTSILAECRANAQAIDQQRVGLRNWIAWCDARQRAKKLGLGPFVTAIEAGELVPDSAPAAFELAFVRWWLPLAVDSSDPLRIFQRFKQEDAIADFRRLDDLARRGAAAHVKQSVRHGLPAPAQVPRKSELGMLRHQMQLKRPSKAIRELIMEMPESFGKLAPCVLMSPLSIAQYLPANQALFDVVIFDEASQITTWDAIGAIARGRQTVIVGDPKQLPPTNFFGRVEEDNPDEVEDYDRDLESILDECQASGLPTLQLNWHYRSRHESLIAFSNWHYYNNRLVTFPAAETSDCGVSLRHLPEAIYDRGKTRTNLVEAQAIVQDAVLRMQQALQQPEEQRFTFGVITFNIQQQSLIQDLFDEALREHPELEWYFDDARIEPTVVKNLENVQGDERDVMYFSVTFGPDQNGKFTLNFGALNHLGGERRLNVAVTRSRQELIVYSAFRGDQLPAERTGAQGVRDLKSFLIFAERGPRALTGESQTSGGKLETALEQAVAGALERLGWQVVPQVGVSGFRVDLGIVHPRRPGTFLAGIACDGPTYHRSATARDRDKIREQVLSNLGWKILRVWSPEWWYNPAGALQQLEIALKDLLLKDEPISEADR